MKSKLLNLALCVCVLSGCETISKDEQSKVRSTDAIIRELFPEVARLCSLYGLSKTAAAILVKKKPSATVEALAQTICGAASELPETQSTGPGEVKSVRFRVDGVDFIGEVRGR